MEQLASSIAGARVVQLDGCGHGAPNSHPDVVVQALVDPLLAAAGNPWR
jgi:pimeloyl-ACP methyl ester carboxylesterase